MATEASDGAESEMDCPDHNEDARFLEHEMHARSRTPSPDIDMHCGATDTEVSMTTDPDEGPTSYGDNGMREREWQAFSWRVYQ